MKEYSTIYTVLSCSSNCRTKETFRKPILGLEIPRLVSTKTIKILNLVDPQKTSLLFWPSLFVQHFLEKKSHNQQPLKIFSTILRCMK